MTSVSANAQFSSNECNVADTLSDLDRLYAEYAEQGLPEQRIYWSG